MPTSVVVPGRVRRFTAGLAVLAGLCFGSRAEAHGGIWRAYEILIEPGDPDHIVLRSDVWALIETLDGGKSWQWVCAELYGGQSGTAGDKRPMILLPGGKMLVASGFDGLRSRPAEICEPWPAVGPFTDDEIVRDVSKQDDAGSRVVVLTARSDGDGGILSQVYESDDQAESFSPLGVQLPPGFSGVSARVAPSDPARVYVTGGQVGAAQKVVARSSDHGTTWELSEFPDAALDVTLRLVSVDPSRPDVLYAWADRREESGGDVQPDSLWLSTDAGVTWDRIFDGVGNLPGFSFSPDDSRLVIAGPEDGLWSADVGALISRGAGAFERVNQARTWGLDWTAEGLYAGGNDFAAMGTTPFSLGLSHDSGATFEPVFVICDVELLTCPAESLGDRVCPGRFSDPLGEGNFKEDFLDSERCAGLPPEQPMEPRPDATTDLSLSPNLPGDETGCSCGLARAARAPVRPVWWALFVLGLSGRRRLCRARTKVCVG